MIFDTNKNTNNNRRKWKNWGFYFEGVWLWRISGGSHSRWCDWHWEEYFYL